MIEQLIFTVLAFAMFIFIFYKMIKNNDTTYVIILLIEAIGIALNFIEVLFEVKTNFFVIILKYLLALLIPIIAIMLEKHNLSLNEIINITKARIWIKLGNNKKAKQALINLITKKPDNYQGHKLLAIIYEKEGGMRKAIDEYVQAIDINKQDYDSYFKVAQLLNNLQKSDEAAEMLYSLLNKKPDYYKATEILGEILISKERYKEATVIYQEALKYNPVSFEINYNLGIVYTMLNDFENAKICYEKAAQINSLLYNAKYSLAEIALIYKEIEEAEKYFMQTLDDEEIAPDSLYELAKISLIKGNKDKAIQYANAAIDANSKKIVPKIKKDPIFIPIIAKISIPFNLEEPEIENRKLTKKDIKVKEHLEEMSEITRHLSYSDIELLNYNKTKKADERKMDLEKDLKSEKDKTIEGD